MPKSRQRCVTSASTSTKDAGASSNSTRSRCQFAGAVVTRDAPGPPAARRGGQPALELGDAVVHLRFAHPPRILSQAAFRAGRPAGGQSAVQQSPTMPWSELDTAAVARTLAQIAEQPDDVADAYFEWREEVELPPEDDAPGLRVWREEGFAVRLLRGQRTWMASRDGIAGQPFAEALRQVARALPPVGYPEPRLRAALMPSGASGDPFG